MRGQRLVDLVRDERPVFSDVYLKNELITGPAVMVLFDSRSILPEGNVNYSLVGLTPDQATKIGAKGTVDGIPSVDADIDACNEIIDDDERNGCWEDLDKKLMEEVVPWVPYLFGNADFVISENVTKYVFDQNSGEPAW